VGDDGFVLASQIRMSRPIRMDSCGVRGSECNLYCGNWIDGLFPGASRGCGARAVASATPRDQRNRLAVAQAIIRFAERGMRAIRQFPLLLEAYRECLRDVFDMPALIETLRAMSSASFAYTWWLRAKASPFASSLLSVRCHFMYEGRALAERRAQALTSIRTVGELLASRLRELLDANAIAEVEEAAQCLAENYRAGLLTEFTTSAQAGRLEPRRTCASRGGAGICHAC